MVKQTFSTKNKQQASTEHYCVQIYQCILEEWNARATKQSLITIQLDTIVTVTSRLFRHHTHTFSHTIVDFSIELELRWINKSHLNYAAHSKFVNWICMFCGLRRIPTVGQTREECSDATYMRRNNIFIASISDVGVLNRTAWLHKNCLNRQLVSSFVFLTMVVEVTHQSTLDIVPKVMVRTSSLNVIWAVMECLVFFNIDIACS